MKRYRPRVNNESYGERETGGLEAVPGQPQRPRAVLYARVSTQEQLDRIQSDFHSLDAQESRLREYCEEKGFEVVGVERDVKTSRNLNRPGIERIRSMARSRQIEVVCAIRYDRLAGGDDFFTFRGELKRNNVALRFADETGDPDTPDGEMTNDIAMKVKERERRVTGEKVSRTFRQWFEKEMYPNGLPPYGFLKNSDTQTLLHDPDKVSIINRMFEIYVEKRSDFAVRDWLQAHGIPSPKGSAVWSVGTITDILQNKRYIGLIERNRRNEGRAIVSPDESYQSRAATTFGPMISKELWEKAQQVRWEQAQKNPMPAKPRIRPIDKMTADELLKGDLRGPTHNDSHVKSGHVFLLQDILFCPVCGHPMSPTYTKKKPNQKEHRRSENYTNYYECCLLSKHPTLSRKVVAERVGNGEIDGDMKCGRVLAKRAEAWAIAQIAARARNIQMIQAVQRAVPRLIQDEVAMSQEAIEQTKQRLRQIQKEQEVLAARLRDAELNAAVKSIINDNANELERQRKIVTAELERMREQQETERFASYSETIDRVLDNFTQYVQYAKPDELRYILRLFIRRMTCDANGVFHVEFYRLHLAEEQYPGLLHRNVDGELEWKATGSRVPWEFYRFENRLRREGIKHDTKPSRRKRRKRRRAAESRALCEG